RRPPLRLRRLSGPALSPSEKELPVTSFKPLVNRSEGISVRSIFRANLHGILHSSSACDVIECSPRTRGTCQGWARSQSQATCLKVSLSNVIHLDDKQPARRD